MKYDHDKEIKKVRNILIMFFTLGAITPFIIIGFLWYKGIM